MTSTDNAHGGPPPAGAQFKQQGGVPGGIAAIEQPEIGLGDAIAGQDDAARRIELARWLDKAVNVVLRAVDLLRPANSLL